MKIVTQKEGKYVWVALIDKRGCYHNLFNSKIQSCSLILVGNLYSSEQAYDVVQMLLDVGHYK